ncbi:hypothetical protein BAUCODRAFT_553229 [Baudoinia panamericana UAMH 10762]|uniref:FHA domain-containing protein n=1 Tax=Baudoinia panamericana (strain UAMH 10762) TaxID=717646 RepID=M2MDH1_BAUPA|nr:uncharacterized protein BAUCODRAFT_553229 [Baudoinia panamericana UAMH 10762]EMC94571.1 hypothetical protein BAUCODRAFT_553229 [Baudoinia panamericana UAMH 10762]
MWLLSCDGDLFAGKRLWLRPGSVHLLGRTTGHPQAGEKIRYIDHKSVSRKHLVISVAQLGAGDQFKLHQRTGITLEDNSKAGTTCNDERFQKGIRTLEGKEYTIRLGHYEPLFHLVWHPVIITLTGLGKKDKSEVLAKHGRQVDGTDVKLLGEYVSNETTHVVAKKRNTAPGLQALVQGRWLVAQSWFDALAAVTKPAERNLADEATPSLLEDDFDVHWPREEDHLLPAGAEPVPRPSDLLKPLTERAEVLQDFTFVFLAQGQYDQLLPVITCAHGKALLWEVHDGESRPEELVSYLGEVAGKKGNRQFQLSQQSGSGGVVVVRLSEGRGEWSRNFMQEVELASGQRAIEQSEFLDPIITLDTSDLRRPLKEAESLPQDGVGEVQASPPRNLRRSPTPPPPNEAPAETSQRPNGVPMEDVQEAEQLAASPVKKKWNRRAVTKSRWQGFQNDFDPSQFTKNRSPSPEPVPSVQEPSQAASVQSMDVDEPGHGQSQRKRLAPAEDEEKDPFDDLLKGQTAFKRRRTEALENGRKASFAASIEDEDSTTTKKNAGAKKRVGKQIDVRAELAKRKEEEEERRRLDEEVLRDQLEGVDLNEIRNKIVIEEMPVREPTPRDAAKGNGDRWDPAWNGRKNFKKFRPQGQRQDAPPRLQRVIVQLEEVPRKGHGIGHEYWLLGHASSGKGNSKSQSQSQTLRAAEPGNEDHSETTRFHRRIQRSREEDAEDDTNRFNPAEIAGTARDGNLQSMADTAPSQTLGTETQRTAAGKRHAVEQVGGPAKKARQTRLPTTTTINIDEDDDDGLKFRRRRRG